MLRPYLCRQRIRRSGTRVHDDFLRVNHADVVQMLAVSPLAIETHGLVVARGRHEQREAQTAQHTLDCILPRLVGHVQRHVQVDHLVGAQAQLSAQEAAQACGFENPYYLWTDDNATSPTWAWIVASMSQCVSLVENPPRSISTRFGHTPHAPEITGMAFRAPQPSRLRTNALRYSRTWKRSTSRAGRASLTIWPSRTSSPLAMRELLWSKFWVGTIPLLVMALSLVNLVFLLGITNTIWRFQRWRQLLPIFTITVILAALELMALFLLKTAVLHALAAQSLPPAP